MNRLDQFSERSEEFELGNELFRRYQRTRDVAELDRAVDAYRAAAEGSGRPERWRNLGVALVRRYVATNTLEDCDHAIAAFNSALHVIGDDPGRRADLWQLLGMAWNARFEDTGEASSLDASISAYSHAIGVPEPNPAAYYHLSSALWQRFQLTMQPATLDTAITAYRETIAVFPPDDPDLAAVLENAGIALRVRFEISGKLPDLIEAISFAQRAVALSTSGDPGLLNTMSNFAGLLMYQFELLPELSVLDQAIAAFEIAVDLLPEGHPDSAGILSNLAGALLMRAWRTDDPADLDLAIEMFRTATAQPDGASVLGNLASALSSRYRRTRDQSDLDEAIAVGRQAVAVDEGPAELAILARALLLRDDSDTESEALREAIVALRRCLALAPEGNRHRADALFGLATALERVPTQSTRAITLYRQAALASDTPVHSRIGAALAWSRLTGAIHEWDDATDGAELAVDLLQHASHKDLARADQEHGLGQWGGLAAHAAACALQLGDPHRAFRLLERGQGVLLSQLLGEDLDEPTTVDRFDGTVVLVNATELRNDAIIVTAEGVSALPLPEFTDVAGHLARFVGAVDDADHAPTMQQRQEAQRTIHSELAWLWDTVAGPVLEHLGLAGPPEPGQEWPRVWWARANLLADLPLHAAGHHDERGSDSPRTVLDRVVSSYTPTAGMLRRAQAKHPGSIPDPRLLIVAVPEVANAPVLHGVLREADVLAKLVPVDLLLGEQATHSAVAAALESHAFVHFACHAVADLDQPSRSRLLLHDHEVAPLTMLDISKLDLSGAGLAFLSACETSRGNIVLSNEAIHITTAFQLAGYPNVIGTLWQINDAVAADVAESVYTSLRASGFDPGRTAFALHATVHALRDRYVRTPSLWAAYMHVGALAAAGSICGQAPV